MKNTLTLLLLFAASFSFAQEDLPIVLSSFDVSVDGTRVALDWTTESEVNNDKFVIYHGTEVVGEVKGKKAPSEYTYSYNAPKYGWSNVLLKQVDLDGNYEIFHKVVDVKDDRAYHIVDGNKLVLRKPSVVKMYGYGGRLIKRAETQSIELCRQCIVVFDDQVIKR